MTLKELNNILGDQIRKIQNNEPNARMDAVLIVSIAKQIINNADVIMRAEKLRSEGVLLDSHMEELITGTKQNLLLEGEAIEAATNNQRWCYKSL